MTVGSCRKRAHTASRSFTAVCAGITYFTASMPCHEASNSLLPRYVAHSIVTCIKYVKLWADIVHGHQVQSVYSIQSFHMSAAPSGQKEVYIKQMAVTPQLVFTSLVANASGADADIICSG